MMIRILPLIAGLAPIVGVLLAYWLNVRADNVPACFPPLDGCTSISAAGRYMPGSMPFRAVLLPQAAFLMVVWWLAVEWLRQISPQSNNRRAILVIGVISALALVLYVTFLGTKQPFYEFMRRFGIYVYFFGTVVSQFLLSLALPRSGVRSAMLWTTGALLVLGVLNTAQKSFLADPDPMENRIEWVAALLMQGWFLLLYQGWRKSGFRVVVQTDSTSARLR